ncbi:MAG TPA: hypothetical protein VLI04_21910, partial [Nocardioidaceae bacterium]|nr:hypothetical protein [Nocardioidaceae bacterium]
SSEVLVKYPNQKWGWGYVDGPRDPSSDAPVRYREQESVMAQQVWLTTRAVVALDNEGSLNILDSGFRDDGAGHHWRVLTGTASALDLPTILKVGGVVSERNRFLLIDAIDESGHRAWVRCDVRSFECEVAAELGSDALTPH